MPFHLQLVHTPVPVQPTPSPSVQTNTQRRKPEKFPRPTVGVDETREGWDNFELNWVQYKEDSELKVEDVSRHLVACCYIMALKLNVCSWLIFCLP